MHLICMAQDKDQFLACVNTLHGARYEMCACKACNKDTMFKISKIHLAFAVTNTTTEKEREDLLCDVIENILLLFFKYS